METIAKRRSAPKQELAEVARRYRISTDGLIRRLILQGRRFDVLAEQVLGYKVVPELHGRIIHHQATNRRTMILAYRGCGKTKTGTVTRAIGISLCNPNIRILIASRTQTQSQEILGEIKSHFETNERLHELFGDGWVGEWKWDATSVVFGRRNQRGLKEPSIGAIGAGGTVTSKHVDVIFADDLVDEVNSKTQHQRDAMEDWYYKVLDPCLEPPADDPESFRGEMHHLGTVFHYDDLNHRLMAKGWKERALIIPCYSPDRTKVPWPEYHPIGWFQEKEQAYGRARFNTQFMCSAEAMKGKVFSWDDLRNGADIWTPENCNIFIGVDPAISENTLTADEFALVVLGVREGTPIIGQKNNEEAGGEFEKKEIGKGRRQRSSLRNRVGAMVAARLNRKVRVMDAFKGNLRFGKQTAKICEFADAYTVPGSVVTVGVETNGYQLAQYQELRDLRRDLIVVEIPTTKNKVDRAWDLSSKFQNGSTDFQPTTNRFCNLLIDQLLAFPSGPDDLFDALDHGIRTIERRRSRSKRRKKVGLI